MTYKIINSNQLVSIAINIHTPANVRNASYCKYVEWFNTGNNLIYEEIFVSNDPTALGDTIYKEELDSIFFKMLYTKIVVANSVSTLNHITGI